MVLQWFYILLLNHHCQKWCAELQDLWAGQVSRVMLSVVHDSSGWRKANSATVNRLNSGWYLCCSLLHNWRVCCGEQQCCSDCLTHLSYIFLICRCRTVPCLPLEPVSSATGQAALEPWVWKAGCTEQCAPFWLPSDELWKQQDLHLAAAHGAEQLLPSLQILCLYRSCAALAETLLLQWKWEHSSSPWSTWSCVGCCSELVPLLVPFPKHSGWLWCSELRMELLVSWEQWGMQRDVFPWSC